MNKILSTYKKIFVLCLIFGQLICLTGCSIFSHNKEIKPWGRTYFTFFDTVSNIYSYAGDDEDTFSANCDAAASVLEEYHKLFDIYHEYSDLVNLCTINKNAGGEPQKVDEKLIVFLEYAKELYSLTNGKMNIMLGAVLKPWHDARESALDNPKEAKIPDMEVLKDASLHTSIDLLEIDKVNKTVRISDSKASLDVGAVGKGYAVERSAQALVERGCKSYVLNVGGNIRTIGTKVDGSGWITGIKDPLNPDSKYAMYLSLTDTSCVTSGTYERYFIVDRVKYHHIIDCETLMPANYFISVSIITKDSGLADALSTALFCMSYEEGKALIEKLENVDVLWIYSDGTLKYTSGIKPIEQNN